MTFGDKITQARYLLPGERTWNDVTERVCEAVFASYPQFNKEKDITKELIRAKKFLPSGRILRNAGLPYHQVSSCYLLRAEDTREGWGELTNKATVMLMTGGGIGVDYRNIRPAGGLLASTGGVASGPCPLIRTINEIGRGVQCGGYRRSAIYASLPWSHPDIKDFIHLKDWPQWLRAQKAKEMDVAAPCDMTNISVALDQEFFDAYLDTMHPSHSLARRVYYDCVLSMCSTGEPGFQVDLDAQSLRNACTEIISADDSDACVLGHANFARLTMQELEQVAAMQSLFLLLCTEYTNQPTEKVKRIQRRNRRLGAGVMGVGEWFIQRGLLYGDPQIDAWLYEWSECVDAYAAQWARTLSWSKPVATRAIAPTGTVSIVAETTSGIEPLFAQAYERRYLMAAKHNDRVWADGTLTPLTEFQTEIVVDPVASKLVESLGIKPEDIETAYDIDPERRVQFQWRMQKYIDNAISSTINLDALGSGKNKYPAFFGSMLMRYLPGLRGLTVFPNGSRGLQPITRMDYESARAQTHIEEFTDGACPSGVCSI